MFWNDELKAIHNFNRKSNNDNQIDSVALPVDKIKLLIIHWTKWESEKPTFQFNILAVNKIVEVIRRWTALCSQNPSFPYTYIHMMKISKTYHLVFRLIKPSGVALEFVEMKCRWQEIPCYCFSEKVISHINTRKNIRNFRYEDWSLCRRSMFLFQTTDKQSNPYEPLLWRHLCQPPLHLQLLGSIHTEVRSTLHTWFSPPSTVVCGRSLA